MYDTEEKVAGPRTEEDGVRAAARHIASTLPRMFKTVMRCAREADPARNSPDLGDSQMWVLHALSSGPQLTSMLARRFNVANPTMTRIVDALVEKGYVERRHDEEDRRRIFLVLTAQGAHIGQHLHRHFLEALERFLSPLSRVQIDEITRAFGHLQSLLPEWDEEGPGTKD